MVYVDSEIKYAMWEIISDSPDPDKEEFEYKNSSTSFSGVTAKYVKYLRCQKSFSILAAAYYMPTRSCWNVSLRSHTQLSFESPRYFVTEEDAIKWTNETVNRSGWKVIDCKWSTVR